MPTSPVPLFFLTLRGRTWFSGSNTTTERDRTDWGTPVNWLGSWWSSSAEETSGCRTRRASSPRARARARAGDRGKASLEKARGKKPEEAGPDLIAKAAGHRRGGASLQRIKSSGNLHWPASQERRRQSAFLQGNLETLTRMPIRDVEI